MNVAATSLPQPRVRELFRESAPKPSRELLRARAKRKNMIGAGVATGAALGAAAVWMGPGGTNIPGCIVGCVPGILIGLKSMMWLVHGLESKTKHLRYGELLMLASMAPLALAAFGVIVGSSMAGAKLLPTLPLVVATVIGGVAGGFSAHALHNSGQLDYLEASHHSQVAAWEAGERGDDASLRGKRFKEDEHSVVVGGVRLTKRPGEEVVAGK